MLFNLDVSMFEAAFTRSTEELHSWCR